jgi:PspA-Associated protein
MIVRISGEDQYELPGDDLGKLNELENAVVATVDDGRPDDFPGAYGALLDYVRSQGKPVDEDDLRGSDVILPPSDLSFDEAGRDFTGEGLIPD